MKKSKLLWPALLSGLLILGACGQKKQEAEEDVKEETSPTAFDLSFSLSQMTGNTNAPELQSFAHAVYGDYWLLLCGRTNYEDTDNGGIHDINTKQADYTVNSFPPNSFNTNILLYNFKTDNLTTIPMSAFESFLNNAMADSQEEGMEDYVTQLLPLTSYLRCSNPLATQEGDYLYIVGGYGTNPDSTTSSASYQTFDAITRIHVPSLVNLLTSQPVTNWNNFYRVGFNTALQSTGGEAHMINGTLYVCGGHNYGKGARKGQQYVDAVIPVNVSNDPNNILGLIVNPGTAITDVPVDSLGTAYADNNSKFRRRDGPMVPILVEQQGSYVEGVGFYGGVFKPGRALQAWNDTAIYVTPDLSGSSYALSTYTFDINYDQKGYNVYSCPDFGAVAYNPSGNLQLYTFLPGGIGNGGSDGNLSAFSNTCVTAVLDPSALTSTPIIDQGNIFDGSGDYFGAEAAFMPANNSEIVYYEAASGTTDFIDVNASFSSNGGTLDIGYIYGGIEADTASPAAGKTNTGYGPGLSKASNAIWKVQLTATPVQL